MRVSESGGIQMFTIEPTFATTLLTTRQITRSSFRKVIKPFVPGGHSMSQCGCFSSVVRLSWVDISLSHCSCFSSAVWIAGSFFFVEHKQWIMVQNSRMSQHLIVHFPTSSGVRAANKQPSGPVLMLGFLVILDHSAMRVLFDVAACD